MKRESAAITPPPSFPSPSPSSSSSSSYSFYEEQSEKLKNLSKDDFIHLICEYKKREFAYLSNIASHEREKSTLISNINECKYANKLNNVFSLEKNKIKNIFFDPTCHLEIKNLRKQILQNNNHIHSLNQELNARHFHAQSIMGQKIIKKCKKLQEENNELGKMINVQNLHINQGVSNFNSNDNNSNSNINTLNNNIASLKKYIAFLKNELKQLRELNMDIDADNEALTKKLATLTANYAGVKKERDDMEKTIVDLKNKIKKQNELKAFEREKEKEKEKKYKEKEKEKMSFAPERIRDSQFEKKEKMKFNKEKDKQKMDYKRDKNL